MSEEEIIEIIEAVKEKDTYWLTTKEFEAMIGLLDLYNKQKEEIDYYKKQNEIKGKLLNTSLNETRKHCISKDKIRDILLKFQNEYGEDLETTGQLFIGKEVMQYGEDMLDEIAKELDIKLLEE